MLKNVPKPAFLILFKVFVFYTLNWESKVFAKIHAFVSDAYFYCFPLVLVHFFKKVMSL